VCQPAGDDVEARRRTTLILDAPLELGGPAKNLEVTDARSILGRLAERTGAMGGGGEDLEGKTRVREEEIWWR
jgi:hypothetical protein